MSQTNPAVDAYLGRISQWRAESETLRDICLASGLKETLKWGVPCYALEGANVVLIHGFKHYCALLFFKGALMQDPERILIQQTASVQAARQIRFTSVEEIERLRPILEKFIAEAAKLEAAGAKVSHKGTDAFEVVDEFQQQLDQSPALTAAFQALTPGRQRAYLLHFAGAKQSKTRAARVEKAIPRILESKGLDDL